MSQEISLLPGFSLVTILFTCDGWMQKKDKFNKNSMCFLFSLFMNLEVSDCLCYDGIMSFMQVYERGKKTKKNKERKKIVTDHLLKQNK